MTIKRIEKSARMSQAVVAGGMVHLAGQVAPGHGIVAQMRGVLAKIDALLDHSGSDRGKLVNVLICLADMADFEGMNSVWDPWIASVEAPARATIQAPLAFPDILVEIIVTASL